MEESEGSRKPEQKSLQYAEDLGLNSVYEHAQERHKWLATIQDRLVQARQEKRRLEAQKADLEMGVAEDERAANPSMSATAMKEHLKSVYFTNADIYALRDALNVQQSVIDQLEYEVDLINSDIKIAVARLHELGGYFQFMAVVKEANEARKAKEARGPW